MLYLYALFISTNFRDLTEVNDFISGIIFCGDYKTGVMNPSVGFDVVYRHMEGCAVIKRDCHLFRQLGCRTEYYYYFFY